MNANLIILPDDTIMEDLFDYLAMRQADRCLVARIRDPLPEQYAMYELLRRQLMTKMDKAFLHLQAVYHQDFEVIAHLPVTHRDLPKLVSHQARLRLQHKAEIRELVTAAKHLFARMGTGRR
jgi:hypothetical protein